MVFFCIRSYADLFHQRQLCILSWIVRSFAGHRDSLGTLSVSKRRLPEKWVLCHFYCRPVQERMNVSLEYCSEIFIAREFRSKDKTLTHRGVVPLPVAPPLHGYCIDWDPIHRLNRCIAWAPALKGTGPYRGGFVKSGKKTLLNGDNTKKN
jgi:hypothetical protein